MPESADLLVSLLKSRDFAQRSSSAEILSKTRDPKYLPLLIDAYEFSNDPSEVEGRAAILDVLAEFNDSSVLRIYDKALVDPEFTIRRHAIDGIKKIAGNHYYHNEKVLDPEDFLYSKIPVSKSKQDSYSADYGKKISDSIAEMVLDKGIVMIRLYGSEAPNHVRNFKKLANEKFYDGLRIHRVVPNFVIQGGDPRGDGWGSGGINVRDEANRLVYKRGMIGMPLAGKDTGGSQFFITLSRQPHLDGNYTIFGEVISGMDIVDKTEIGDIIRSVRIKPSQDELTLSF
jgi:cyclophilin family peptidyl-prolyl cis-trans isomerase